MARPEYGNLFLIPNSLSQEHTSDFFSEYAKQAVHHLTHFIVENEKSARALLKKLGIAALQADLVIREWNVNSKREELPGVMRLLEGNDAGIISEAGLPCIADPGSDLVAWAHSMKIKVIPLPGASSIIMGLMASGFNGQSFAFHGYLPIDKAMRAKKLKELEADITRKKQTQLFMETPYRNNQMLEDLIRCCSPQTMLCIACEITAPAEMIKTRTINEWVKEKPDLHKRPAIFIMG